MMFVFYLYVFGWSRLQGFQVQDSGKGVKLGHFFFGSDSPCTFLRIYVRFTTLYNALTSFMTFLTKSALLVRALNLFSFFSYQLSYHPLSCGNIKKLKHTTFVWCTKIPQIFNKRSIIIDWLKN